MPRSFEFSWDIAGSNTLNVQKPAEVTFVFTGSESITRKAFARPRDMSVFSSGVMYADGATIPLTADWKHEQANGEFVSKVTVEISPNDEGDLVLEVWLEGDEDEIYYATLDVVEADDGPTKALPKRGKLLEPAKEPPKKGLAVLAVHAGVAARPAAAAVREPAQVPADMQAVANGLVPASTTSSPPAENHEPAPAPAMTKAAAVTVEADGDDEDLDEVKEDEEVIINADSETDEEEPGAYADDDEEDEPAPTEALKGSPQPLLATSDPKRMRAGTGAMTMLDDQQPPQPGAGDEAAWRAESPTSFVSKVQMREAALREDDNTTPEPTSKTAPSAPATPTPEPKSSSLPPPLTPPSGRGENEGAPAPSQVNDEDDGTFRLGPVVLIATFVACLVLTLGVIALLHFAKERMLENEAEVAAATETPAAEPDEPIAPLSDEDAAPELMPATADADNDGFAAVDDCDDNEPSVYNDADEICDGRDNDCDGTADEDVDCDADGFVSNVDCKDDDASVYPDAPEICGDAIDQDCSGLDLSCADVDNDLDGLTENQGDCNDADAAVNPGAEEKYCDDGIDTNCDGADPVCADVDLDGDGWSENGGDCDEEDATVKPGAAEVCGDGIDQDCDGGDLDCNDVDNDRDGWSENEGDCNDADAAIPGEEVCGDTIDQDCDGSDLPCPPVVERLPLCPNFAPEGPFVTFESGELAYHMVCDDATRRACPVAKTQTLPDGRFTFNVKDCVKLP